MRRAHHDLVATRGREFSVSEIDMLGELGAATFVLLREVRRIRHRDTLFVTPLPLRRFQSKWAQYPHATVGRGSGCALFLIQRSSVSILPLAVLLSFLGVAALCGQAVLRPKLAETQAKRPRSLGTRRPQMRRRTSTSSISPRPSGTVAGIGGTIAGAI